MSEVEMSRQPALPEMDAETYALVQELFQLVRAGDAPRLANLLQMGLPANLRDGQGNSLLMLASYHGHHDMTKLLLEHGGDPQLSNDRGQIPLAGAAFKGDIEMARLLIEHGADIDGRSPDGKTPLMFAAMFDRIEIIDLFLAHGADISAKTEEGMTAADLAKVMGAQAAVERLDKIKSE
jgi:ankyrin repeat protein